MGAKYSAGAKVRIRSRKQVRWVWYSQLRQFEGMTGEVVSSASTVGYPAQPWAQDSRGQVQTIQCYKLRLDNGAELDFVVEDYLEGME